MDRPTRPFRISDGLVLVAVAALGLVTVRPAVGGAYALGRFGSWGAVVNIGEPTVAHAVLVTLTSAALGFALRPPLARSVRDPGVALCLVASAAAVAFTAQTAADLFGVGWDRDPYRDAVNRVPLLLEYFWVWGLLHVGAVVAGSALALAVTGRLRPAPQWPQRLAWWVGVAWAVQGVATVVRSFVV